MTEEKGTVLTTGWGMTANKHFLPDWDSHYSSSMFNHLCFLFLFLFF